MKTMTAKELYQRKPVRISHDISMLIGCYFNHIKEITDDAITQEWLAPDIEIRIVFEFDFDHRRFWRLATVWYKGDAVMIIQNAGREGDDHAKRFITNKDLFKSMLQYIHTLVPCPPIQIKDEDIITLDEDREDLHHFYGDNLDGYFNCYD